MHALTKRPISLLILCAFLALPVAASAQSTIWRQALDNCNARGGDSVIYWSPGVYVTCWPIWGKFKDYKIGQTWAARDCRKKTDRFVPTAYKGKIPCRLAYMKGRVRDSTFGAALRSYPALPAKVEIFDAKTGKVQRGNGRVLRLRTTAKPTTIPTLPFRVEVSGARICEGTLRGLKSVSFTVVCFGEKFTGRAKVNKVVRIGGQYALVPSAITLKSGKSYLAIAF